MSIPPKKQLRLIGHFNPTGRYPGRVIPILSDTNRAQYFSIFEDGEVVVRKLSESTIVVFNSPAINRFMEEFDCSKQMLIAISESKLMVFDWSDKALFFQSLLDNSLLEDCVFFRLSLAKESNSFKHVLRELVACLNHVLQLTPHLAQPWYDSERVRILLTFEPNDIAAILPRSFDKLDGIKLYDIARPISLASELKRSRNADNSATIVELIHNDWGKECMELWRVSRHLKLDAWIETLSTLGNYIAESRLTDSRPLNEKELRNLVSIVFERRLNMQQKNDQNSKLDFVDVAIDRDVFLQEVDIQLSRLTDEQFFVIKHASENPWASDKDIAKSLGISQKSVRSSLSYAKERLIKLLIKWPREHFSSLLRWAGVSA